MKLLAPVTPVIAVLAPWGRGVLHIIAWLYWVLRAWKVDKHAHRYLLLHVPSDAGDWYLAAELERRERDGTPIRIVAGPHKQRPDPDWYWREKEIERIHHLTNGVR